MSNPLTCIAKSRTVMSHSLPREDFGRYFVNGVSGEILPSHIKMAQAAAVNVFVTEAMSKRELAVIGIFFGCMRWYPTGVGGMFVAANTAPWIMPASICLCASAFARSILSLIWLSVSCLFALAGWVEENAKVAVIVSRKDIRILHIKMI